jgi:hypothetical protein
MYVFMQIIKLASISYVPPSHNVLLSPFPNILFFFVLICLLVNN